MTSFGSFPLLERVTNDEFLELLPYLSLEHYLLTQVYIPKKKWIHVLDANLKTLQLKCLICSKQIRFEDTGNHLRQNDHLISLRLNVKQFYHPFYTYGKGDIKLARGEHAPQEIRESALREVNLQMKSFRRECIFANQVANIVKRRSREIENNQLIQMALVKMIDNPDDMIIKACLPFECIAKLFFCVVSGEWQTVIGFKSLTEKATFQCKICSINCCGIESLNSHLNGYTHRLKQLDVLTLRYEGCFKINKNCCIQFGKSFSFSVKENVNFRGNKNEGDFDTNVSKEITNKIKLLDEYVPKVLNCVENKSDKKNVKKSTERERDFDANEILGHLGVEYVLNIVENENDRDPRFECGLCEFVGDVNKMQRHLLFYEHKKKYLDLHYSDTIKKYEAALGHMSFREFRAVMSEIVDKIAVNIEKHHSRSLPYTVSLGDYKARRPDLIAEAYALLHASQNRGPSFSNVLLPDDIRKLKNSAKKLAEEKTYRSIEYILFTKAPKGNIYLNQLSHDPVVRLREYNVKMNTTHTSSSMSPTHQNQVNVLTRKDNLHNERLQTRIQGPHTRSRSPITVSRLNKSSKCLNQNIWDIYRREIAVAAREIEIAYENYRKNPESHPLYEEEWNNFWQHRKKELERDGFNHRTYNFQPEWVHYFKQRIEVLFGEALHKSQINVRHRLEIPVDAVEEDFQRSKELSNQCTRVNRRTNNMETLNEGETDIFKQTKRHNTYEFKYGAPEKKKKISTEQMHVERKKDFNTEESHMIFSRINDNHSNVVHVLRLMTALEEHLGSLGGRVMELLSNALHLEKNFPGNDLEFESKVLTISNCQLLETAMEKLKGILFAGFLDEKKISGFNRVIQHIANLLKYAEKMGWRQDSLEQERKAIEENAIRNRDGDNSNQLPREKTLSDTLMGLVKTPQTGKQQMKEISKEQYNRQAEHQLMLPVCPPPPNIREVNTDLNFLGGYKGFHQINSGLATFNTKLSIDRGNQTQKYRQPEFGQLQLNPNSGGNSLYNNSFRNSKDARTNTNSRTNNGPNIGGGINNNVQTSSLLRNSDSYRNIGQNSAMFHPGRDNRNQNWSRWNKN